jgi:hypothetical protein
MPNISESSSWLQKLTYPLKALYSRDFYTQVLTKMRGIGFVYLLLLSAAIAAPASLQVSEILQRFQSLELATLVGQLPPSYLNEQGRLSPNEASDSYKLLYNSKGKPSIIYNTDDKVLTGEALQAPIELNSQSITLKTQEGSQTIPYNSLFEVDSSFSPLSAAQALDTAFSSSFATIWSVVTIWFLSILLFNTLLTALLSKFLFVILSGISLKFVSFMRFCAFGNTVVAILLLAQYYVNLHISYSVMSMLPLIYTFVVAREYRSKLKELGPDGFAEYLKAKLKASGTFTKRSQSSRAKDDDNHGSGSFAP